MIMLLLMPVLGSLIVRVTVPDMFFIVTSPYASIVARLAFDVVHSTSSVSAPTSAIMPNCRLSYPPPTLRLEVGVLPKARVG